MSRLFAEGLPGPARCLQPDQASALKKNVESPRSTRALEGGDGSRPGQGARGLLRAPIALLASEACISRGEVKKIALFCLKMQTSILAKRNRHLMPLLAVPASLLLGQGQAKAVLTYNIFESAGNVVVQTSGSLNLTGATPLGPAVCDNGTDGAIQSVVALICTGPVSIQFAYAISGPVSFDVTVFAGPASSVSGITTSLLGDFPFPGSTDYFGIDPAYISATPIVSSATFNGQTLATIGFTTTGLIGTWSLTGTSETIKVFLGDPPSAAVPGPLPLLDAGAAFGWSRRLRKRISTPLITPPQT